jgi:hypothetical protein
MTTGVRSGRIGHCYGSLVVESSAYKHGTNVELLKAMKEKMEMQIGSLASLVDAHHERTIVTMDAWLEDMRAWKKNKRRPTEKRWSPV